MRPAVISGTPNAIPVMRPGAPTAHTDDRFETMVNDHTNLSHMLTKENAEA